MAHFIAFNSAKTDEKIGTLYIINNTYRAVFIVGGQAKLAYPQRKEKFRYHDFKCLEAICNVTLSHSSA